MRQPEGDFAHVMNSVMREKLAMKNLRIFFKNDVIKQLWWDHDRRCRGYYYSEELQTEIIEKYLPSAQDKKRIVKHLDKVCQFEDVLNFK